MSHYVHLSSPPSATELSDKVVPPLPSSVPVARQLTLTSSAPMVMDPTNATYALHLLYIPPNHYPILFM
jgi:hypothetical protein